MTTFDYCKEKRYKKTLNFLIKTIPKSSKILDLGTSNDFSKIMQEAGYNVKNTSGENLDVDFKIATESDADVITAFEIFEHMLAPFNILNSIKNKKIIASIPLNLWFANSYWNENDDWDKHYHEFEPRQFELLLKKTNWDIIKSEKWKSYNPYKFGFRPLLRRIYNRYYIVYCEKKI
ncbi:MAG: methyltransferase [Flavobacteriales bacterium]|mgnify:FL=1|nr:methyltransferase [Flavobacteriales bacterium]